MIRDLPLQLVSMEDEDDFYLALLQVCRPLAVIPLLAGKGMVRPPGCLISSHPSSHAFHLTACRCQRAMLTLPHPCAWPAP